MIGLYVIITVLVIGSVLGAVVSERARRVRPGVSGVHLRRDDFARNPIARPLCAGAESFEVGVRLDEHDRLVVARAAGFDGPAAAIGPVVLRPLALQAEAFGGRVRTGAPLTLAVEIMETDPDRQVRAYERLDTELRQYAYLFSNVRDGQVNVGAVTVSLIGPGVPRAWVAAQAQRYVFCDGTFADVGPWGAPVVLVPTVSEHWSWRFGWDGTGAIPAAERIMLREYVAAAHADGRAVRVYGLPDGPSHVARAYWRELRAAGVDVISTGRPRALARYIAEERRHPRPAPVRAVVPMRPLPIWRARPPRADRALGHTITRTTAREYVGMRWPKMTASVEHSV